MTTSGTETSYRNDDPYRGRGDAGYGRQRQERGFFISTEARPGFITSEFWLTVIGVIALGILAYASDALGVRWGMGFATAVLLGYVLSRTTGLPDAKDDIGNWTEPLGLASLFVEGGVVAVVGAAFLVTRRSPRTHWSPRLCPPILCTVMPGATSASPSWKATRPE